MNKYLKMFLLGFIEQTLYTLYLISITKYLVELSSILMFVYMTLYLLIINYAIKDKDSIKMLLVYALSAGIGNYVTMAIHLIK